jgi:hypothetical protein
MAMNLTRHAVIERRVCVQQRSAKVLVLSTLDLEIGKFDRWHDQLSTKLNRCFQCFLG